MFPLSGARILGHAILVVALVWIAVQVIREKRDRRRRGTGL